MNKIMKLKIKHQFHPNDITFFLDTTDRINYLIF